MADEIEVVEYNNPNNTIDLYRMQQLVNTLYTKMGKTAMPSWSITAKNGIVAAIQFQEINNAINAVKNDYTTGNSTHHETDWSDSGCNGNCSSNLIGDKAGHMNCTCDGSSPYNGSEGGCTSPYNSTIYGTC